LKRVIIDKIEIKTTSNHSQSRGRKLNTNQIELKSSNPVNVLLFKQRQRFVFVSGFESPQQNIVIQFCEGRPAENFEVNKIYL